MEHDPLEHVKLLPHLQRARKAGKPATLTQEEWKQTVLDFGGLCAYCQQYPYQVVEHFIPVDIAGTHVGNCVPACATCNSRKHRRMGTDLILLFGEETINRITQYLTSRSPRKLSSRKEKLMQVIEYKQQRILTTQQIAEAYEADKKLVSQNFKRHEDKYTEGKHYYKVTGEEKKEFLKAYPQIEDSPFNAQPLYLWTKSGALMHAKSLNTDKAWQMYEQLVDTYFFFQEQQQTTQVQERVAYRHHQEHQYLEADFMAAVADANRRKLLRAGLEKIDDGYKTLHAAIYGGKAQKQAPVKQIAIPSRVSLEFIQAEMTRHFERLGPMTFNKLRTSYMKSYDISLLEAALKALLEKHIVIEVKTNHATKYQLAQDTADDTETQS